MPLGYGELARKLFAIGLFDAGFLGALSISLSRSWAVGEVFGWAHSLNQKVKDAPWFYIVYLVMLITSGAVVLIPGAPLITITMFVQVVAVTLLPAALVFLLLFLDDNPPYGRSRKYTLTEHHELDDCPLCRYYVIAAGNRYPFPGFIQMREVLLW